MNFVKVELTIPLMSVTFSTDSVVELHFIRNRSTHFDVYTSNRLALLESTSRLINGSTWKPNVTWMI